MGAVGGFGPTVNRRMIAEDTSSAGQTMSEETERKNLVGRCSVE